jgi:hypothetical protein
MLDPLVAGSTAVRVDGVQQTRRAAINFTNAAATDDPVEDMTTVVLTANAINGRLPGMLEPVRAVATSPITLAGTQAISGVIVAVGNSVLTTAQTNAPDNRLWVVASGAWTARSDFNASSVVRSGVRVPVAEGLHSGVWHLATIGTIALGTTSLSWIYDSGLPAPRVVRATTTSNIVVFQGAQTHDGVDLVDGDSVLVAAQTDPAQNGIMVVHEPLAMPDGGTGSGYWLRRYDLDENAELVGGLSVYVQEGTINANTTWHMLTPITPEGGTWGISLVPLVWIKDQKRARHFAHVTTGLSLIADTGPVQLVSLAFTTSVVGDVHTIVSGATLCTMDQQLAFTTYLDSVLVTDEGSYYQVVPSSGMTALHATGHVGAVAAGAHTVAVSWSLVGGGSCLMGDGGHQASHAELVVDSVE